MCDDGAVVNQVTRDDQRITGPGHQRAQCRRATTRKLPDGHRVRDDQLPRARVRE